MARAMKDSGIAWIGSIPEEWALGKVCHTAEIIFLGKTPEYSDEENSYYTLGQKNNQLYGIDFTGIKYSTERHALSCKQSDFLQYGDILLNSLGTGSVGRVGFYNITDKKCLTDGHIIVIRPNGKWNGKYVYYFLSTLRKKLEDDATGSTNQAFLTIPKIYKMHLPAPSFTEQRCIADFLDRRCTEIDSVIAKTEKTIEEYKALKQSIITEAVTKGIRHNRPMKDSGIVWIGEINSNYSLYRLKHLLRSGLMYGANESGISYEEKLPRYVRITDITLDGKLKNSGQLSLTEEQAAGFILSDKDVLFARSGATVGKAFIYKKEYGRCAFAGYLIKASVNRRKVLPEFLFLYTQSSIYEEWKKQIFIQATIQNIGADRYNELPVVIPQIEEQTEIVNFLECRCNEIDHLIYNKQQLLSEFESYKKSSIYEYVTGKKVVR